MGDGAVLLPLLVGVVLVLLVGVPDVPALPVAAVATACTKSYGGGVTCGFKGQIEKKIVFKNFFIYFFDEICLWVLFCKKKIKLFKMCSILKGEEVKVTYYIVLENRLSTFVSSSPLSLQPPSFISGQRSFNLIPNLGTHYV